MDANTTKDASSTASTKPIKQNPEEKTIRYADRPEIYPRNIKGIYRNVKWITLWVLLGIYHIVPWLRWDRGEGVPDQMILMDLSGRRAYFFDMVIWPQEVYYLTGILILAAIGLFFVTSLFGRVWCGFTCPQTVWTDLFFWVERQIEGESNARRKLDKGPWTAAKIFKKGLKHFIWLIVAFLMSFAWVWYFNDAPTVTVEILQGTAGSWVMATIAVLTITTYLLAGWAREQVCYYMCPWPRFQGTMFDEDTLLITYEDWRGEPRAPTNKLRNFENRGHCIDCTMCVQVCPTGVDIRLGQQMQCIGCGLCIDACDGIMEKMNLPKGLIRYDSISNGLAREHKKPETFHLVRPRTMAYVVILLVVMGAMGFSLGTRSLLDVTVLRDRAPLFVTLSDGSIRNGYTYKILNKDDSARTYTLSLKGLEGASMTVIGVEKEGAKQVMLDVVPDTVGTYKVFVKADKKNLKGKSTGIEFILVDNVSNETIVHDTVFAGPGR
ncbi:MAG: cytochrome c oxidase accessory protein CcoG [Rhodospirillales bacterium]|nr:cytochrome c oxidase accessory protein CcoG [Rhodospirillales bacterium]